MTAHRAVLVHLARYGPMDAADLVGLVRNPKAALSHLRLLGLADREYGRVLTGRWLVTEPGRRRAATERRKEWDARVAAIEEATS